MFGIGGGSIDTILGAGAEFRGNIHIEGSIMVDGKVDGNISASERITLGIHAAVHGNLNAPDIVVGGMVHGHVVASGKVHLLATAQVDGDIKSPRLSVIEGAIFSGKIGMAASVQALADSDGKARAK